METPYMYLFVREDLSPPQQIIQTAHATDDVNKMYPHSHGNHMVLCEVHDEEELVGISEHLSSLNIVHQMFYEPDVSAYTAIATQPLRGKERRPLRKFKLKR